MSGLEAISAHNGWMMAVFGGSIVFSGLVILSIAITFFPKILALLDKNDATAPVKKKPANGKPAVSTTLSDYCPSDMPAVVRAYKPLIDQLEASFELTELYALARKHQLPHPHLTIKCFREAGILNPQGEGRFNWNP